MQELWSRRTSDQWKYSGWLNGKKEEEESIYKKEEENN